MYDALEVRQYEQTKYNKTPVTSWVLQTMFAERGRSRDDEKMSEDQRMVLHAALRDQDVVDLGH